MNKNRNLLITIEEVVEKKNPSKPYMAGDHVAQTTSIYTEIDHNNEIVNMVVDNTVIHEEDKKEFVRVSSEDKELFKRILNRYIKIK
ncbi:hypothetical protein G7L40_20630 [Paenibacillus polymyxa]|uniref:Uncharacterized protein n=1 Tax=Paenibacillus polymyxa TaxID=1406 RepID=A0A378Y0X0_PAEPO|nr:hypothetical protein [Paenibacillus polymyxa]MBE7896102.1 hypothetical protein [Paenibacillus polymyxa]MBG9765951.1 hypothetical protein [Paenibacillus polymyxa]MCC3256635.1 hypothetical protein [Paenibacillus polymyxa]QPK54876.1 hypothetical protein G7035_20675 [Paenibacillus polymyxa]QPK59966.1 hypothetical protein G7L40_20630 [Paenibacillus polymyxa]